MKLFNKTYKTYPKATVFIESYPFSKTLNFKRSKWKRTKRSLKQFLKKKFPPFSYNHTVLGYKYKRQSKKKAFRIFDSRNISVSRYPSPRARKIYSTGLMLRRSLGHYSDYSLNLKFLKKYCGQRNISMHDLLLKPLYKVDVLLWKLQLYSSTREVRQDIRCKLIQVNETLLSQPCFLSKGDIVTILSDRSYIKKLFVVKSFFYPFCEVDLYSQTIVIVKGQNDFLSREIPLLFKRNVNIESLFYYLRKK